MVYIRTRRRRIESNDGQGETATPAASGNKRATKAMRELAVEMHVEGTLANAHAAKYNKARKSLFKAMKDASIDSFNSVWRGEEGPVTLSLAIQAPVTHTIDVAKLRTLVDDETFMKIVAATKAQVDKLAGTDVTAQCSTTKEGTSNVNLTVLKPEEKK